MIFSLQQFDNTFIVIYEIKKEKKQKKTMRESNRNSPSSFFFHFFFSSFNKQIKNERKKINTIYMTLKIKKANANYCIR
jgi:hypothetical protein